MCELAIVACDLAEVIGTAIALQLLFGIPLFWGVCLTVVNVFVFMLVERRGMRWLESSILSLILLTGACLLWELFLSRPSIAAVGAGLVPNAGLLSDPAMLYVAIGIVGATVMPHNLYLHSAAVQSRKIADGHASRQEAIGFATIDSTIALSFACLINAALLILAASAFNSHGHTMVADIGDAHRLLAPALGTSLASILFGIALLASGQNSTVTGTLAGQIVMEGFTNFRLPRWMRRLLSRLLAIVPAAVIAARSGTAGIGELLIFSQVALSLQLPFAIVPLIRLTSDRRVMGEFANRAFLQFAAWIAAAIIILLNTRLLYGVLWHDNG